MLRKFAVVLRCAAALMLFGTLTAVSADDGAPFPNGFRDWFFVNSLTATANSPLFGNVAGVHHIYVNAKGLPILKANGPFPYPDGTIFADDVHEFSVKRWLLSRRRQKFKTTRFPPTFHEISNSDEQFRLNR